MRRCISVKLTISVHVFETGGCQSDTRTPCWRVMKGLDIKYILFGLHGASSAGIDLGYEM